MVKSELPIVRLLLNARINILTSKTKVSTMFLICSSKDKLGSGQGMDKATPQLGTV